MDPNIRDEQGENKDALLTYAARHRRWQAMEMLLEAGADVNIRSLETIQTETITTPNVKFDMHRGTFGGKTPLFVAASQEGPSIVELLLKHGADVNAIDDAGNNALGEAILTDRVETVRILLEAGCNPDQRNKDGKTMRELAVDVGYPKIKEMLMTKNVETLAK
ncbi:MAG: ankyrin repeat domain-containing protein [Planctomycetaceae bacterium]